MDYIFGGKCAVGERERTRMTGVSQVTSKSFRSEVLESAVPVVVDFYADWCVPCRQVSPALEALSHEWEGLVRFVKLDIDRNSEVARAYRISSIPAVLLFEDGDVKKWSLGAKPGYVIERELGLSKRRSNAPSERESGEPKGLLGAVRRWWQGA